jgi:autoinducer 2 (AI-2) kinase
MRAERPDDFARVRDVLSISDWIAFKLSGERASDPSQAGETLLLDLQTRSWSEKWIEQLGLPREIFPKIRESGTKLGPLCPEAAEAFGLTPGIAVAMGGGDTQCGLLGAGAVRVGDACAVAGTTGPIQLVVDRPAIDAERRLWTGHHVIPGHWVIESNCGPLGETLDWFARLLFPEAPAPVVRLLGEAATSTPGARGLISSLGAEVMNAKAMGLPVGHLTLSHLSSIDEAAPRRHLVRSVVEGMACALRANLEQILEVWGGDHTPLRLAGGLAQSETFVGILAGVLGEPIAVPAHAGATALGAALCAGVGAGAYPDLATAAERNVKTTEHVPAARQAEDHAALYARWSALRTARAAADAEAATLSMPFALGGHEESVTPAADSPRPRALVAADFDEASLIALEEIADVTYAPFRKMKRMLTGASLVEALQGYRIFVTEIDLVDAASLEELPELRIVGTCRGDAVNVDIDACSAFGIPVLNAPGRNADAVADLALAFLLMLARKLPAAERFLCAPDIVAGDMGSMGKAFATLQGQELWHKTIGLVGLGAVGRKVAQRLSGFGARVLVSDPFVSSEQAALVGAASTPLETLLRESDFVSLHAAVTPETTGMLGARELGCMKPHAFLVNTARAALVDEQALIDALEQGRLAGAALDTFSVEPPGSDHPFMKMENVVSTPHVGGNTSDVSAHQGEMMVADLRCLLAGQRPLHVLNPAVLDAFEFEGERLTPGAEELARLKEGPPPAVTDLQKKKKKSEASTPPSAGETAETIPAMRSGAVPEAVREGMKAILVEFIRRIVGDEVVAAFAEDKDVTLNFTLTDLDLSCYFHLGAGEDLTGGVGDPGESADVQLRMRAAIFDGMFSGTANPMEAAMDGRLSFTGDAAKAMTLQQMQSDLERLYKEARAAAGPPGDLEALPDPTTGAATAPAPAPAGSADPRVAIVATVQELYDAELITATGGNVSARIANAEAVWITPSRLFKGDLAPEVMVRIDLEGSSLDAGARSPSSEWDVHCAIYRAKPEATAVIHAHAPNATILANTGLPFLPISTEAAFFGDIPRVPFIMPGTHELAQAVGAAMADGWAVLMVNHGLIVAGRSLRSASDMIEIIERSAEIILGCHAVGKEPPVLPDDVVETLRKMGDLVA